jgi:hypothetical protein
MLLQSSLFFPGSMVGYPIRFTTLHTIAPVARYRMMHDRCWRLFFSSRIARWRWFLRGCAFVSRLEGKRGWVSAVRLSIGELDASLSCGTNRQNQHVYCTIREPLRHPSVG